MQAHLSITTLTYCSHHADFQFKLLEKYWKNCEIAKFR